MSNKKAEKLNKWYFTKDHENAIITYNNSINQSERDTLYNDFIGPAFNRMVDSIIYSYKFNTLPNIFLLRKECKVWLVTVLDKFSPDKGYKAFSYFSVITKNWFIHKVKSTANQKKTKVEYVEMNKDLEHEYFSTDNDYHVLRDNSEFWMFFLKEMEDWEDDENLKEQEKKVLQAIQILANNLNDIEIFNRKAFYLYIRELTSLSNKQIINSLIAIRGKYKDFKGSWDNGEWP